MLVPGGRLAILEFAIPATRGVRQAYLWYFKCVLPRIGRLVSRHDRAYEYLPASVGAFASPDEVVKLLRQAGFTEVTASPLTFGIVIVHPFRNRREDYAPIGEALRLAVETVQPGKVLHVHA